LARKLPPLTQIRASGRVTRSARLLLLVLALLGLISVFQPRAGARTPPAQQPVQYQQQPPPQFALQQPGMAQAAPQPQFLTALPPPPPGMVYGLVPIAGAGAPPAAAPVAPTVEAPGSAPAASPAVGMPPPPGQQQPRQMEAVVVQRRPVAPQPAAQPVHQVNDLYEDAPEPR
jgi:hypothetical protein